jgi:microcystin-dependent protein
LLPISEYETLFNLIGTTFGGDGQSTFALPSVAGRVPVHMGTNPSTGTTYTIGEIAGVGSVTLTTNQIPSHTHQVIADNGNPTTNQTVPTNMYYGNPSPTNIYSPGTSGLHPFMTLPVQGGSQPHENMQPFVAVTYIISLFGIFPSPT